MRNVILLIMVFMLSACEHKELCYKHPHNVRVKVVFDWKYAPEAAPKGMCVYFYSLETDSYKRVDFNNLQGGSVDLRVGKYRVLSYNNDTESVHFRNTDTFDDHSVTTREGDVLEPMLGSAASPAPRSSGTDEEKVVISPDMMWGCSVLDVEITDDGVSYVCSPFDDNNVTDGELVENTEHIITLYPRELVCTYTYDVRNVKNMKYMQQMSGTISGMSGMLTFSTEELDSESVTIPFAAVKADDSTITGKFYTFGHHETNADPHKMVFYVIMNDGAKYCFKDSEQLDVTDQVHNAPNKRRVHIIIDGLDLPQPIENGDGFIPSVDDWIVEEHDIIV